MGSAGVLHHNETRHAMDGRTVQRNYEVVVVVVDGRCTKKLGCGRNWKKIGIFCLLFLVVLLACIPLPLHSVQCGWVWIEPNGSKSTSIGLKGNP